MHEPGRAHQIQLLLDVDECLADAGQRAVEGGHGLDVDAAVHCAQRLEIDVGERIGDDRRAVSTGCAELHDRGAMLGDDRYDPRRLVAGSVNLSCARSRSSADSRNQPSAFA